MKFNLKSILAPLQTVFDFPTFQQSEGTKCDLLNFFYFKYIFSILFLEAVQIQVNKIHTYNFLYVCACCLWGLQLSLVLLSFEFFI